MKPHLPKRTSVAEGTENAQFLVSLVEITKLVDAVRAARAFMDYLRAHVGFNDEWPIELKVAEDAIEPINTLLNNFEQKVYAVKLPLIKT